MPATEVNVSDQRKATHCFACKRKLTDPVSVEWGIGPVCRKRLGLGVESTIIDPAQEDVLKALLTECSISAKKKDIYRVFMFTSEIRNLGFDQTAHEIEREFNNKMARLVIVRRVGDTLRVRTPHIGAKDDFRKVGSWDPKSIEWVVNVKNEQQVKNIIDANFKGYMATSAKGVWIIGSGEKPVTLTEKRYNLYMNNVRSAYMHTSHTIQYGPRRAF